MIFGPRRGRWRGVLCRVAYTELELAAAHVLSASKVDGRSAVLFAAVASSRRGGEWDREGWRYRVVYTALELAATHVLSAPKMDGRSELLFVSVAPSRRDGERDWVL